MIRRYSFFFIVIAVSSCASARMNPILSQEPDIVLKKEDLKALNQQANLLWASRHLKESLVAFIEIEENVSRSKSRTEEDLTRLARAYYLQGEYFSADLKTKIELWEKASNWAEKALTLNSAFKERILTQKVPTDQALDTLSKKDADALYWFAVALGKWASTQGLATKIKYKDRVKKMIDRVAILQPHYFYGAVYRFNGVYFASLPVFNQEDLKNSQANFEKALKRSPDYFANHVLFAEFYAKKVDDTALYKKHLEFVVNGNAKSLKDVYSEQVLEQTRAAQLLEGMKTP